MTARRKGRGKGGALPTEWFGDPLPEKEAAMWAALSTVQKEKAIQRIKALDAWIRSNGAIDVKRAATDAGVKSLTRMYEMGKAWRDNPSLASVGAFAGAPKTRVGKHDAAIRKVLGAVVAADPEGSVRKLALDLQAAIGTVEETPGHNTFRRYVEEEKRRREQKTKAGNDLMLDCSACTLTPSDTALLTLFTILDRATQVVFGAALGDVADSRAGYAAAARDAIRRFDAGRFSGLPWVERMARAELVAGEDVASWIDIRAAAVAAGVAAPLEPSTREKRFGRYLRPLTGLRIGTVVVMPRHTTGVPDVGGLVRPSAPTEDQNARLAVEVDDHNAGRLGTLTDQPDRSPPKDLGRLLRFLAAGATS